MNRLDKELVIRKLVPSRTKATELISSGFVCVNGEIIKKTSQKVGKTDKIDILFNDLTKYVSRGGLKLEKALKVFNITLKDKVVLDIGSSTGGFTDVSLKNGAKKVIAVDVGTNLLHDSLRDNKKVVLFENTDIRDLKSIYFREADIVVTDVSFISLSKIIEKVAKENKSLDIVCLIKPQFEVGKDIARKYKGIILNSEIHKNLLVSMQEMFNSYGYFVVDLDYSPIKGGDGNIEYIAHLSSIIKNNKHINYDKTVEKAFLL